MQLLLPWSNRKRQVSKSVSVQARFPNKHQNDTTFIEHVTCSFRTTRTITALFSGISLSTRTTGSVNSIVTVLTFTAEITESVVTEWIISRAVIMRTAGDFCQIDHGHQEFAMFHQWVVRGNSQRNMLEITTDCTPSVLSMVEAVEPDSPSVQTNKFTASE